MRQSVRPEKGSQFSGYMGTHTNTQIFSIHMDNKITGLSFFLPQPAICGELE